jgi:hypothetical protein
MVSVTWPTSMPSRNRSTCGEVVQPERVPTVLTVNGGSTRFGTLSVFSRVTVEPVVLVTICPDVTLWAFACPENIRRKRQRQA